MGRSRLFRRLSIDSVGPRTWLLTFDSDLWIRKVKLRNRRWWDFEGGWSFATHCTYVLGPILSLFWVHLIFVKTKFARCSIDSKDLRGLYRVSLFLRYRPFSLSDRICLVGASTTVLRGSFLLPLVDTGRLRFVLRCFVGLPLRPSDDTGPLPWPLSTYTHFQG